MGLFGFNVEKKLAKANEQLEKGFYYEARMAFEEILGRDGIDPGFRSQAKAGWRRARLAQIEGQMGEAKQFLKAGEREAAIECLHAAVTIADEDIDVHEAKEMLATLEPAGHGPRAALLEGLDSLPIAAAVKPEQGETGETFGESAEDLFEVYVNSQAQDVAERYRKLGPEFRDGYLLLQAGELDAALERFDAVPEELTADPIFRLEKGQLLMLKDRNQEALDLLQGLDLPKEAERRRAEMAAILLDRLGRGDEAEEEARRLWSAHDGDPDVAVLLSEILVGHERFAEALAILKPFVEKGDPSPELVTLTAKAYVGTGQVKKGKELLEEAVEIFFRGPGMGGRLPRFPLASARDLLSLYIAGGEEPTKVRSMVQHLIIYDPDSAELYKEALVRYAEERLPEEPDSR